MGRVKVVTLPGFVGRTAVSVLSGVGFWTSSAPMPLAIGVGRGERQEAIRRASCHSFVWIGS